MIEFVIHKRTEDKVPRIYFTDEADSQRKLYIDRVLSNYRNYRTKQIKVDKETKELMNRIVEISDKYELDEEGPAIFDDKIKLLYSFLNRKEKRKFREALEKFIFLFA